MFAALPTALPPRPSEAEKPRIFDEEISLPGMKAIAQRAEGLSVCGKSSGHRYQRRREAALQ